MHTLAKGNFLGGDDYDLTLSQTVAITAGEILSGWGMFVSADATPQDSAWVRIRNNQGDLLAQPWHETSGVPGFGSALLAVPSWQEWQWVAPATGIYTVQLGMSTSGANNDASYGCFDHVFLQSQPVPEPTSMALGLVGGMVMLLLRNRRQ
jgi:hypothetical protein